MICGHGPEPVAARRLDPEQGVPGFAVADPFPALVRPVVLLFVAPLFDEAEVFLIRNQITAGREVPHFVFLAAEFVVPSIERVVLGLAQNDAPSGDRDQFVLRRLARFGTDAPKRQLPDHLDRKPANDDRGGFQVDPLVFNPHQDHPERIVPVDGHRQGHGPDGLVHNAAHGVAIRLDLVERRPVVMRSVQVIPGHLIDTDREHGFESGIDPLVRDLGHDELIDVESRRMPEIEDQGVPQRFRPQVEGILRGQSFVKLLVQAVGGVEILPDFLSLFVGVTLIEDRGSRVSQVHGPSTMRLI